MRRIFFNRIGKVVLAIILLAALFVLASCSGDAAEVEVKLESVSGSTDFVVDNQKKTVEFTVDADSETFSLSRIRFSNHSEIVFKAYSDRECTKEIKKEVALLEGETVFYIKAWHKDARSEKSIYTVTITKPEAHVHAFGEWSVVTAPTCEDNGQKNRTCQGCGYSETEVIPAEGHAFVDKICQKCGTELNYTEGLSYKRKEKDSGYSVTGIASATDTDIVIPSQYNGLPVIDIDLWAFHNCSSLRSVEIPSSVTTIGAYAFDGCRGLKSVTFGENSQLTSIGSYAFRGCNGLKRVFIGDIEAWCSIDFYGTESNPLYYAHNLYLNGELVTELEIPDGVTSIGSSAFENCSGLISVTFGENSQLASIGSSAFEGCSGLISVSFGENSQLTSIGSSAFYNCRGLTSVTFGENSQLTSIGLYAFDGCSGLTSIEIPSGVTSIGYNAFDGCSGLTSIEIPASVTSIGNEAFRGCDGLTISCEATSKPSGWDTDWNKSNCTVVWDCNNNEVGTDGYAYVTIDTIRYARKDGVATVARQPRSLSGDIVIPISIAYKGVVYPVTSIGEEAFYGCGSLTSIEIPASVTSIGDDAFRDCGRLTIFCEAANKPSGWSSFWNDQCPVVWDCNNNEVATDGYVYGIIDRIRYAWKDGVAIVTRQPRSLSGDIVIPISIAYKGVVYPVTSIGGEAFYGCGSLTSIEIPASVTSIGANAFYGCTGLTSITLPFVGKGIDGTSNTHFGYIFGASTYKDQGDYVPDSLRTVMITGGTRGERPGSMTSVASNAFFNCSGLTRIELPNSVSYIGMSAFYNCNGLTSMEIPSGVTSIAPSAFYNCSRLTSITLPFIGESIDGTSNTHFGYIFGASSYDYNDDYVPKSLRTVMITGGTQIGNSAFYGCGGLTDIKLPRSVISIGLHAFYGCSGLTSVTFDDNSRLTSIGASAFEGCGGLVSVNFGNDSRLTKIGDGAFSGCGRLTNFEIPAHVMKIGTSAFSGCNKLIQTENGVGYVGRWVVDCDGTGTTITLRDNTVGIAKDAFFGRSRLTSIAIPSGVAAIGASAFGDCSGLTRVTFGENSQLTSIGESAFSGCGGLTSIAIPSSVTSVGASAFEDCSGLKSVSIGDIATWCAIDFADAEANPLRYAHNLYLNGESVTELVIPSSVTSIGDYALEGCSGLTSIEIPSSVTSIGEGAFYNCSGLTRITFGANSQLTSIGKDAFYYCNGLTKIEIPSGVTSIGDGAFYYCSGLTSVAIPSGVTSIGEGAFYNCGGLTRITFGENSQLTSIGKEAFFYCSGLTSIEIPSEVARIGENAFFGCSRLTNIVIPSSVTNVGASAFSYCSGLTSVYYGGTSKQWAKIAIGSVNSFLTNAMRYYYSETPPYDGGNYWHYVDGKPTKW